MNALKQILSSIILVTLVATPVAHARDSIYSTQKEVVLSDNPPTFVDGIKWMALMCAGAYVMHKILGTEASQKQAAAPEVVAQIPTELTEAVVVEGTAPAYYSEDWQEDPFAENTWNF